MKNNHIYIRSFLFFFIMLSCTLTIQAIKIESVQCEFSENPCGIDTQHPRFGWILSSSKQGDKQTSYEIKVARSVKSLKSKNPDCWYSGKVLSDKSQYVAYEGKTLKSGERYYWTVRVWDSEGKSSKWSDVALWDMALEEKDWKGKWIGAIHQKEAQFPADRRYHGGLNEETAAIWGKVDPLANKSIMLRREFTITEKIKNAQIYVSGLGHYNLYINGKEIDNSMFKPLWSDYDKTVYYNTFDITNYLKKGENVIGVILGNGMYNVVGERYAKFRVGFGPPTLKLQAQIDFKNGTKQEILSDENWKYDMSPIQFNCLFGGEDYDATKEQKDWNRINFNDSGWKQVVIQDAPKGKLTAQFAPPVTVSKTYPVKEFKEYAPHSYFFNMGQNLSGFPSIKVKGEKGQKVRLVVGDVLNETNDRIDQRPSGSPYYLEYTLKGEGIEEWTPMFTYYGYQYVEIENIDYKEQQTGSNRPVLLELTSNFCHLSTANDGQFECSNPLFNQIHLIIDKATRSNMQAVFTDCPHREKLGWLEETHLNGPGLLFNYDLRRFFPKVLRDISDAQRADGLIPDIAPEYVEFSGGFIDSPEWGSAGVIVPWMYYEWYGDDTLIRDYYSVMKRYADYLGTKANKHILSHGLGDWYDYGERRAGPSQNTPIPITATAHYYMVVDYVAKAAEITGNRRDQETYRTLANNIKNAYNTILFDVETAQYGSGSQCSNALPLFMDIVPEQYKEKVLANLLTAIEEKGGKLSTGDVGNRYLYQALAKNGQNEIMYKMHNHKEVPGYGFQIDYGVTTLTEQWDPRNGESWNHFMMGQIEEWFYKTLGGIKADMQQPGFKHFYIEPIPVGDLTYVNSSYNSMYGVIQSNWKKENEQFILSVTIPVNTTATIILPGKENNPHIVGSGSHTFRVEL